MVELADNEKQLLDKLVEHHRSTTIRANITYTVITALKDSAKKRKIDQK